MHRGKGRPSTSSFLLNLIFAFLWFSWCSLENETETVLQEKDVKESVTLLVDTVYLASGPEWCQNLTYWVSGKHNQSTLNTFFKFCCCHTSQL